MRNYVRVINTVGMAACICSAALTEHADAQSAGSITLSTGWLHIAPQGNATPLTVESVGGETVNRQLSGTGAHATSTNTVGITTEYYVTDNIGVAMLFGLPLTVNLVGDGTLAKYGNLGSTRPMPPAIELRYHLFSAGSKLRPFIGLGVNYTWFTQVRTTNSQFVMDSVGAGWLGTRNTQFIVESGIRDRGELRDCKALVGGNLRQLHAGKNQADVRRTDRDWNADRFAVDAPAKST
ncbi:outer membrane protein W [Paraburkholderia sp. WSM4174]